MLKNYDTNIYADLRPRKTFKDELMFSGLNLNVCMVIFAVIAIFLYCVVFVVASNPIY
ncbi:MAG: hypothetical protein MJ209_07650 [archaeon]|nr:hypothetical protein [archaeon]